MDSYVSRVNVDDGAYVPGYRGDEVKKVSEGVLYRSVEPNYNPVGDEINSYMSGESYLSSVNDIAVMENDDITKIAPHHTPINQPVLHHESVQANSKKSTNKIDITLWILFFVFIIFIVVGILYDFSNSSNYSYD